MSFNLQVMAAMQVQPPQQLVRRETSGCWMEPKPGSPTPGMHLPLLCSPPQTRRSNTRHDTARFTRIYFHITQMNIVIVVIIMTANPPSPRAFYFLLFVFRVCRASVRSWSPCHTQGFLWGRRKISWASKPHPLLTSSWRTAEYQWATCWALVVPGLRSLW